MTIQRLEVNGFRNLTSVRLFPSPRLNLLYGENASGKTSLLEAIYFLSNARSFRTGKVSNLIKSDCECFTLFTETQSASKHHQRLGMKRCRNGEEDTRIDGTSVKKRSLLIDSLPLQIISPESLSLLVDSAERRRAFIDWGLFHVEHSFREKWSNFSRSLKQRNALLRIGSHESLQQWNTLFVQHAERLSVIRQQYVDSLVPCYNTLLNKLLPELEITIGYAQGWKRELPLIEALRQNEEQDLRLKYTTAGPQRADLVVRYEGKRASELLSRGQMKLVVVALLIAQMETMAKKTTKKPTLLVDDLGAELDPQNRVFVLERLHALESQIFITTPEKALLDTTGWNDRKMFHVEHGEIKEMV